MVLTKAQQFLLESDFILELLNQIPAHVFWKDRNSVYLGCNNAFAYSLGLSDPTEIVGKTDYDLPTTKEESDSFRADDQQVIESKKSKLNIEECQTLPDGKKVVLLTNKVPLLDKQNNVVGILGIYHDISERKQMEEKLRQSMEEAETANRAKSEFLRNIEHQLRTPFSGVYTIVQMLADEEQDPAKKELLEMTYMAGIELLELLNDVIDISRDEVINPIILVKKFDLKQLVEKAVIMEKPAAEVKHLQLTCDYPQNMPNIYIGDSKRIQRILLHLISNAIKFTEQGHIDVEVKLAKQIDSQTHVIQLIVKDTGIGIAKENQNLIYERFYRASPANHNKYKGAGLGLYVVRQLIDELEGEIDVLSAPGKGSSFICTLPLRCPLLNEMIENS